MSEHISSIPDRLKSRLRSYANNRAKPTKSTLDSDQCEREAQEYVWSPGQC